LVSEQVIDVFDAAGIKKPEFPLTTCFWPDFFWNEILIHR
jgi:hypothetical protein